MIQSWQGHTPKIPKSAYVHESAQIIGRVTLGENVSIWPNVVLRGDIEEIVIGDNSNIQDGSVVHTDSNFPVIIAPWVTVGHNVILHGCQVATRCIIGMGSILLNGSKVEEYCIVGAGAVVSPGTTIPKDSMALGIPARVVRALKQEERDHVHKNAENYVLLKETYKK